MKAVRRPATKVQVVTSDGVRTDEVATEEPLQIRAHGPGQEPRDVAVTMRTPGHDFELAVGYLSGLGSVHERDDVRQVEYCGIEPQLYNVVTVVTSFPLEDAVFTRRAVVDSSCGACGANTIDEVRVAARPLPATEPVPLDLLVALPPKLRTEQSLFDRTGGVHAAGRFRRDGTPVVVREDVGRHNAIDKVVGASLLRGPTIQPDDVLVLSGRVAFELVQKAALAGFGIIVAVSAPTSLAVQAADELGLAILGFTRDGTANVYSHRERVM